MGVRLWRFALTACLLSAVATPGSPRAASNDGICMRMKLYVAGDGKRAVDGTAVTYCASEKHCRKKHVQVCCNGWRRDPDSKTLRCIKEDPDDSAVDIATDVGNYEDSTGFHTGWIALQREAGVEHSARGPRGSRSAKTDRSGVNAPDGLSVQTPEQVSRNRATDPPAGSGADRGNRANPPVVAGPAGTDANHSLTNGSQPVGTTVPPPEPNATSTTRPPADAPHTGAEKQATTSGKASSWEASKGGSQPANGATSQPEGPPRVVIQHQPEHSAISHSAVNQSEVDSQTPGEKDHNSERGDSKLTTVAVAPESSPVSNRIGILKRNRGEALTSPLEPSGGNHASVSESEPPANLSQQSGDKSSDNRASVDNSQALATPPGQSKTTQANVKNTQAPATPPGQSNDNHASVKNTQAPATPPGQSNENQASVDNTQAPATPPGQSNENRASVKNTQAPVTPPVQSNDNRASVDNTQALATPPGQSKGNQSSVNNSQALATPPGQSKTTQASVNNIQAPTTPPGQSNDNQASVNNIQAPTTPPGQSGDNPADVKKSEALASPKGQSSDNRTTVNNTGDVAPVQSDQNSSSTVQNKQDASTLTLSSKDLVHGRYEETVPSTESLKYTSTPPDLTPRASVPLSEATATQTTAAAVTPAAQNETSHNSVHIVPSATAATRVVPHSSTTAASVDKPIAVPAPRHPNAQPGNTTVEYNVTVETNNNSGTSARSSNSSVRTGRQGGASAANPTEKTVNTTGTANCTAAGNKKDCTGANCLLPGNQKVCNSTAHADGLQTPPAVKPQPRGGPPLPPAGSATKTASEVTISLLLVAAVAFVAALLYWRSRRRLRQYINCGTREPNLHFSNPVYDLEAMMEQTSLVKLQNAADIEDGDGDDSEHEATSQRK